jgi:hypothetical protein
MVKEMTTEQYMDAMDYLADHKTQIERMDIMNRHNALSATKSPRRFEATLIVFDGADVDRMAAIRRNIAERTAQIDKDKKNGRKYWETLAHQLGIPWYN